MALARQTSAVSGDVANLAAAHLLLTEGEMTEGEISMMAENPEQVMEDIQLRATQVSSVLEAILMEPHGRPDWGINE